MSHVIRFGIDLAKNTFAICGVDEHEHITVKKTVTRKQLLPFFANTPSALIAMEAGSGAHHRARELKLGDRPHYFLPQERRGMSSSTSDNTWEDHH